MSIETVEKRFIKTPSDGEYESGLLCNDCDNKFLGDYYENYASRAIYGGVLPAEECPTFESFRNQHGMEFIKCSKLNYHKFKLFLLSILWRASISKRPFFNEINLKEHEEMIRQMLLSKNAGEVSRYPIVVMTYAHDHTLPKELISQPRFLNLNDNIQLYSFMINGYFYFYYVTHDNSYLPEFAVAETIKPSNELNILVIPKDRGWDFILGQSGIKNEPIQLNK